MKPPVAEPSYERQIELAVRQRNCTEWKLNQLFRVESRRKTPRTPKQLYPIWKAHELAVTRDSELAVDAELARYRAAFAGLDDEAAAAKWEAEREAWTGTNSREIVARMREIDDVDSPDVEQVNFAARELRYKVERWHAEQMLALPIAAEPRNLEIEKQIEREIDRDDNFAIYADWLQANGNPRGELIVLEATRSPNAARVLEQLQPTLLGPLADIADRISPTWRLGFLDAIAIELSGHDRRLDITRVIEVALALPSARFLRRLTIALPSIYEEVTITPTLVAAGPRPALRQFALTTNREEGMLEWTDAGELSAITALYPNLEVLELLVGAYTLTELTLPRLKRLSLRTCHAPLDIVATLLRSDVPMLEELELWFGSTLHRLRRQRPGYSLAAIVPILSATFPKLRRLGVCNCEVTDELCAAIVDSPLLPQLQELSFANGTMTAVGAEVLIANAARFAHLEKLDVDGNYLDRVTLQALAERLPIRSESQRELEPHGGRYAAVSE